MRVLRSKVFYGTWVMKQGAAKHDTITCFGCVVGRASALGDSGCAHALILGPQVPLSLPCIGFLDPMSSSIHLFLSVFIYAFASMKTVCRKRYNEDMGSGAGLHCRTIIWRVNVVTFCNTSFCNIFFSTKNLQLV